jgi:hypothetical protein
VTAISTPRDTTLDKALTEEDRENLKKLAERVARKKLIVPAVLFLESIRPLNFIAASAVHFANPITTLFLGGGWGTRERFAELLENRESVDYLIELLEKADRDLSEGHHS